MDMERAPNSELLFATRVMSYSRLFHEPPKQARSSEGLDLEDKQCTFFRPCVSNMARESA